MDARKGILETCISALIREWTTAEINYHSNERTILHKGYVSNIVHRNSK